MKQTDVTVTFYLKKSEMNDEGHCPVMAKLVVGKFSEAAFSAKMSVPAALWASGRATGKSNAAREINRQLDDLRASAISIYAELSATRENVTAEEIRNLLLGGGQLSGRKPCWVISGRSSNISKNVSA